MSVSNHVLIGEDEAKIAAAISDYLRAAGYRCSVLARGDGVVEWIRAQLPDAVLLDLMLPGEDGLSICRRVREFSMVPIIVVTARVEEIDRLLGLEFGADDYLCKPFSLRELAARLKAVLRRSAPAPSCEPHTELISLDAERFELRVRNQPVAVTPVEFRLLRQLMLRPGAVLSRERLLGSLYEDHRVVSDRTVDSHVRNLRRKFAEFGFDPIVSVYGVGFRFDFPEPPG